MAAPVLDIPAEGLPGEFWIEDRPRSRGRILWDERSRPSVITDRVTERIARKLTLNGIGAEARTADAEEAPGQAAEAPRLR